MKGDPYEYNIPNTFLPNCTNKVFSVAMLAGVLKFGIDPRKFPPEVEKRVWAEHHRQVERNTKKHEEKMAELETYKQKIKQDYDIRYLADEYVAARSTAKTYWMIERVCSLPISQRKLFFNALANIIKEDFVDKRTKESEDLIENSGSKENNNEHTPYHLADEFLDKISVGEYEEVIEKICKLDDSKNKLLSFLSCISGSLSGSFETKPGLSHV